MVRMTVFSGRTNDYGQDDGGGGRTNGYGQDDGGWWEVERRGSAGRGGWTYKWREVRQCKIIVQLIYANLRH
jgi:hypothetical protein